MPVGRRAVRGAGEPVAGREDGRGVSAEASGGPLAVDLGFAAGVGAIEVLEQGTLEEGAPAVRGGIAVEGTYAGMGRRA